MNKNKYDFDNVIQKAPLTGKVYSRQGRITSTRKAGDNQGNQSNNKFLTTSEKIFQAQNKLRNDKQKGKKDPEKKIKQIEEEINDLINDSNLHLYDKQLIKALEVAKEAQKKLKYFEKYLENNELTEFLNQELKFSVQMNLAQMYEKNKLIQEALAEYQNLLNARANDTSFLVRVNMGNLHFQQNNYTLAIKMYKMSLDMAPSKFNAIKYKIMKNIGHSYVKRREFVEAITAYEDVMNKYPDYETAFNLILCLYTIGDKEKIKPAFTEMLNIETYWNIEEENQDYEELEEKQKIQEDPLIQELQIKRTKAIDYITNVAKLIAPVIEDNILRGYEWLIETLKNSKFPDIQSEIEIAKALYYVKNQNIDTAIQTLKSFEKKDKKIMTLASSNLSFLYLLENDIENAEKYADIALQYDRFNVKALVNKGNCYFQRNNFQKAKQHYLEAIGIQADCVEALYNLAFVNKKINLYSEALTALEKLRSVVSNSPEVVYQIASIYELHQDTKNALKWYDLLSNMVPNDPNILSKIGLLYSIQNDESQSFYHYLESFKLCPTNLETIAQLGIHYVRNVNYEKACYFFEKAAMLQPKDLKWKLMIASCQRRMENYEKALSLYEYVHNQDPSNQESLNFLVQINQELGRDCAEYQVKLKKLERELEAMEGGYVNFEEDYMQEQVQKNMHDDQDYQNYYQQPQVEERKQHQEIDFEDDDVILPDQLKVRKFYIYMFMVFLQNNFFSLKLNFEKLTFFFNFQLMFIASYFYLLYLLCHLQYISFLQCLLQILSTQIINHLNFLKVCLNFFFIIIHIFVVNFYILLQFLKFQLFLFMPINFYFFIPLHFIIFFFLGFIVSFIIALIYQKVVYTLLYIKLLNFNIQYFNYHIFLPFLILFVHLYLFLFKTILFIGQNFQKEKFQQKFLRILYNMVYIKKVQQDFFFFLQNIFYNKKSHKINKIKASYFQYSYYNFQVFVCHLFVQAMFQP